MDGCNTLAAIADVRMPGRPQAPTFLRYGKQLIKRPNFFSGGEVRPAGLTRWPGGEITAAEFALGGAITFFCGNAL
jgi:hypothetical protein